MSSYHAHKLSTFRNNNKDSGDDRSDQSPLLDKHRKYLKDTTPLLIKA
jgi:hypothetical protein